MSHNNIVPIELRSIIHLYWFCGVVVITSASHAEGREFKPHQNLLNLITFCTS